MRKHSFWQMGTIGSTALSGIEIALWDIFAKSLGVSVWRLLGGKTRDRVKVYTHLGMGDMTSVYESMDTNSLIERAATVTERGYRAVKVVFIPYTHYTASPKELKHVGELMRSLREAVGDETEVMVDFHGRCASTSAALHYLDVLEPYQVLFVEEPIPPDDTLGMKALSQKTRVPLAAGERLINPSEFDGLFQARAVTIAQPDLCRVGGFSSAKRIAALAEQSGVGVAPHNPLGPIAGVAALHFDVSTPNFVIQEEMTGAVPWYREVVDSPIVFTDGYWEVPDCVGLGIEVNLDVASKHPFKQEVLPRNARRASRRYCGGLVAVAGRLANKVAVVTGAGQGIGEAIARAFVHEGAKLVVADINEQTGRRVAETLTNEGFTALFVPLDVTEPGSCRACVEQTVERLGKLDILVNNAGVNVFRDPLEMSEEEWRRCFAVDLDGVWHCTKAALPVMLEQGGGSVVNVASCHSFSIIPNTFPYPVVKHGLLGLTRALGIQYARQNIRVNAIAPGYVETQLAVDYWQTFPDPEAERQRTYDLHPQGRIGQPKEVAMTAVFLASDEAPFINASCLVIDGGRSVLYHE